MDNIVYKPYYNTLEELRKVIKYKMIRENIMIDSQNGKKTEENV